MQAVPAYVRGHVLNARSRARRVAFTLLEVLIVAGVIAILALMLIPSMKRSVRLAASTVCMHNLRSMGQSLHMYRFENNGWLPQFGQSAAPAFTTASGPDAPPPEPWFLRLWPAYMADLTIMTCPEDPFRFRMPQSPAAAAPGDLAELASYGINSFMMTAGDGFLANLDRHRSRRPLDTILLADIGPDVAVPGGGGGDGVLEGPPRNGSLLLWDDSFDPYTEESGVPWLTARHGVGINVLTIGGDVRSAETRRTMQAPLQSYYPDGAAGGCTLCNFLDLPHYSFASDRLYWWTGHVPLD
ncbi:MAG: type II secretion system protein [Phycisphaerae bacterium]